MRTSPALSSVLRVVLLGISLGSLSACSAVRIAYQQLDWLLERRVAEYVTLDDDQESLLEGHIEALLDWHCSIEVPVYARWLREVNADFQGPVELRQLERHSALVEEAWRRLMLRSTPAIAELFASLSDEQASELLAGVDRDNEIFRKSYLDPPDPELRRDNAKWMRKSLRRWLGPLTEPQKAAVRQWSDELVLMGEVGWAERLHRRNELETVLGQRRDAGALRTGLERLLIDWETHQEPEYRRRFRNNSELTAHLLVRISRLMTATQKARMSRKTRRYAADLESLACGVGKSVNAASGAVPGFPAAPAAG